MKKTAIFEDVVSIMTMIHLPARIEKDAIQSLFEKTLQMI